MAFSQKDHLEVHQRAHIISANITRLFAPKGHLKVHQKSHTHGKQYQYSQCDNAFTIIKS